MKKITLAFLTMLIPTLAIGAIKIESKDAAFYEGENVIACGEIKEVSRFKRGVYINLDNKYPKQSLTLIVWENDLKAFNDQHGSVNSLINKKVCGKGEVTTYKGRNQISLYNSYSMQVEPEKWY